MTTLFLRLYAAFLIVLPASARTDEMFTVAPRSEVMLGEEGGDTFGMESQLPNHVVILLNPAGEDCTLRFPLRTGERFQLRIRAGLDQTLACEVSLNATGKGNSATFNSRCEQSEASAKPRCPAHD